MKVILLKDIKGIGKRNEIKEVSDGYGFNFLIPKNLARPADPSSVKSLENSITIKEKGKEEKIEKFKKTAKELEGSPLIFRHKTSKGDNIFGSVGVNDIKKALNKFGLKDFEVKIKEPIKKLGSHSVDINLGGGIGFKLTVRVESE